jgi:hypothetical protein
LAAPSNLAVRRVGPGRTSCGTRNASNRRGGKKPRWAASTSEKRIAIRLLRSMFTSEFKRASRSRILSANIRWRKCGLLRQPKRDSYLRLECRDLRNRTPIPAPFSSRNSSPAASSACCNFDRASSETLGPKPPSTRLTVGKDRPAREASSVWDHPKSARAARSCSTLVKKIPLDPFRIILYDPFWIMAESYELIRS